MSTYYNLVDNDKEADLDEKKQHLIGEKSLQKGY